MPDRHSRPLQPRSTAARTKSSHGSPAAAVTSTAPGASAMLTLRRAIWSTRASTPESATTTLEPPPSTRTGTPRAAAQSSASSTEASSRALTSQRAGPPTRSVVRDASEAFSMRVTRPF
jgi:hypothetical protein